MPPPFPCVFVGTHTVKVAEVEEAMNFRNELFSKPKQGPFNPDPGQSCMVEPEVLPHSPLKSHTAVALLQEELGGSVFAQAGMAGGSGAGVLLKVRLQFKREPELPELRRS